MMDSHKIQGDQSKRRPLISAALQNAGILRKTD